MIRYDGGSLKTIEKDNRSDTRAVSSTIRHRKGRPFDDRNGHDQIKLSYEQNMFSVHFASDNYILPEKTEYAYKLEGFNEGWMTTAFGKVTYTNLAPGTYMLKVKAVNSDGYGGLAVYVFASLRIALWMLLVCHWLGWCQTLFVSHCSISSPPSASFKIDLPRDNNE